MGVSIYQPSGPNFQNLCPSNDLWLSINLLDPERRRWRREQGCRAKAGAGTVPTTGSRSATRRTPWRTSSASWCRRRSSKTDAPARTACNKHTRWVPLPRALCAIGTVRYGRGWISGRIFKRVPDAGEVFKLQRLFWGLSKDKEWLVYILWTSDKCTLAKIGWYLGEIQREDILIERRPSLCRVWKIRAKVEW